MHLTPETLNEIRGPELEDQYPVNMGYLYLADDKLIRSPLSGTIVALDNELRDHADMKVEKYYGVKFHKEIAHLFI